MAVRAVGNRQSGEVGGVFGKDEGGRVDAVLAQGLFDGGQALAEALVEAPMELCNWIWPVIDVPSVARWVRTPAPPRRRRARRAIAAPVGACAGAPCRIRWRCRNP